MDAFIGGPGLRGVAYVIVGGVATWMFLSMCILKSPLVDALVTKDTRGVSKVDVVERVTGGIHALISSGFGIFAWTAVSVGQCTYDSKTEMVLRFGTALTASYLINDFIFLFLVEVVQKVRDPWWSMWVHHINIIMFFFIGLASNQISWFMCANLINEVSTIPINVGYMMKAHGYSGSLLYNAVGMFTLLAFTVLRSGHLLFSWGDEDFGVVLLGCTWNTFYPEHVLVWQTSRLGYQDLVETREGERCGSGAHPTDRFGGRAGSLSHHCGLTKAVKSVRKRALAVGDDASLIQGPLSPKFLVRNFGPWDIIATKRLPHSEFVTAREARICL